MDKFDRFRAIFWEVLRPDRVSTLAGAVALAAAGVIVLQNWPEPADAVPTLAVGDKPPADTRTAQNEISWLYLRSRLQATEHEQRAAARAARRGEVLQTAGVTAGVGLVIVGLGLILTAWRAEAGEAARAAAAARATRVEQAVEEAVAKVVKPEDIGSAVASAVAGVRGATVAEPRDGQGEWSDRLVRFAPGLLALVCGAVLTGYAVGESRPVAVTPSASPAPPAPSFAVPQAFPAFVQ